MASKQLKLGLGNTVSGNQNKKQYQFKHKQIEMGDFDVEMLSPNFMADKTLKKPMKYFINQLERTNPNGTMYHANDKQSITNTKNTFFGSNSGQRAIEELQNLNKTKKFQYNYLNLSELGGSIKPAYKPVDNHSDMINGGGNAIKSNSLVFSLDDKNTIFSAMTKKGSKPKKSITFANTNQHQSTQKQSRTVGKAQSKLKKLFNKDVVAKPSQFKEEKAANAKKISNGIAQQIGQDIEESIDQYGDQSFEKASHSSGLIKQSIRQDLGGSSGFIKESIKQSFGNSSGGKHKNSSIMEEIKESFSKSQSKGRISEAIGTSHRSSSGGIKQQIGEQLGQSGADIYQEIFEEYEESLSKSRGAFKKSSNFKESTDQLSKSFRKKTNVVKSIKLAEEISIRQQSVGNEQLLKKMQQGDKFATQLLKEKASLTKKKTDLGNLFKKKDEALIGSTKNKNLLYEFRIELNKMMTGKNFQSKLHKLTSFINFNESDQNKALDSLQDKILTNIMGQIQNIKRPQKNNTQIQKMKQEYDDKLKIMLKDQQINLRVEMDKKLHDKDMQLKKMIAELQQRFQGKAFISNESVKLNNLMGQRAAGSDLYEIDSDYSIDSDNVSWKADLWAALPQYQQKKLYEKQGKQVTNFLTDLLINEIKQESLDRSLDISFEFPEDANSSQNASAVSQKKKFTMEEDSFHKPNFNNKKQTLEQVKVSKTFSSLSGLPELPKAKQIASIPFEQKNQSYSDSSNSNSNVNPYSKTEGQQPLQPVKRNAALKQQIIQILSKYKSSYLRKKNDIIRKILKTIKPKQQSKTPQQHLVSVIQNINILNKQDINSEDLVYVQAYEQELIWALVAIIDKSQNNKKTQLIEQEMRKNYDRLVVLCQIKAAENAQQVINIGLYEEKPFQKLKNNTKEMQITPCPLELLMKDEAVNFIEHRQQTKVKKQLVEDIMSILMEQFAKDFPKRKK